MLLEDTGWQKWVRGTPGKNCSKQSIYKATVVVPQRGTEAIVGKGLMEKGRKEQKQKVSTEGDITGSGKKYERWL